MDIRMQMLGTGTAFAKTYYNNNALLYTNGYTLLIDCGVTAPRALHELGKTWEDIDGIYVSHLHADHVGGLEEAAFRLMYQYKMRKKLFVPARIRDMLWSHTLRGGLEDELLGYTKLDNYFDVVELYEQQPVHVGPGLKLEIVLTDHVPGKLCFGAVINDRLYYSADSRFNRERIEGMVRDRGCLYVLHDCQLMPPETVHATLPQLLTLPEPIQERVLLMHYGDDTLDIADFAGHTGRMRFVNQHRLYEFALDSVRG